MRLSALNQSNRPPVSGTPRLLARGQISSRCGRAVLVGLGNTAMCAATITVIVAMWF
jgi:hypothetical protein